MSRWTPARAMIAISAPLYYMFALAMGLAIIYQSARLRDAAERMSQATSLGSRIGDMGAEVLKVVTFGLVDKASERDAEREIIKQALETHHVTASAASFALALATAAFLVVVRFAGPRLGPSAAALVTRQMCGVALCLFVVGVFGTAMGYNAFGNPPVLGEVTFKHESKSIASTIATLMTSGNVMLGTLIALFSIAMPLGKLGLMTYVSFASGRHASAARAVAKAIGKWSMVDVFVVALLLAYFALNQDENTSAHIGHGMYFFVGYCLVSMWAGAWAEAIPVQQAEERLVVRIT
jgi:paraquat-inducible protein A